ncbi:MAG: ABC transporter ATP-binding protein [Prevotellaceae bacterium]|nr:ABC transporter ATP-binding protein [Prevotellaceae bacterium]
MILAHNITKSFGSLQVLKGIDLEIKKGELVTIVGASGAGKTTLLQILGTLSRPDTGKLFIDGVPVFDLDGRALADFRNRRLGFVFQFHHLLPEFTALENVAMPALIARVSMRKATDRATELLAFLKLDDRLHHKPGELSGGEQQRVAVARALMNRPAVLLADEPSGNLDSKSKHDLHALFFSLRDALHQTIIIVTHDLEFSSTSDRSIALSDGRIL